MPIRKPKFPNVYHNVNRRFLKDIWDRDPGHAIPPKDKIKLTEFELKPKEKIHFFAAFSGEWAKALKDAGLDVDVSDITHTQLDKLKKYNFGRVLNIPAQFHNLIQNIMIGQ